MPAVVSRARLAEGACLALKHSITLLLTAAGLHARNDAAASFSMAVMAREEHGRFNLLAQRFAAMSDADSVAAMDLSSEMRDHKPKLSAGQSVTPVPMSASERKEWEAACLTGNDAVASAISDTIRARAEKLKPHQVADLHARRLKAQYIDIDIETGTWITPSSISIEETATLLRTVHAELANTLIAVRLMPWLRDAQDRCGCTLPTMGDFSNSFFAAAFASNP